MDSVVQRLHRALAEAVARRRGDVESEPVTVAEIYQELAPYRTVRSSVGFEMNADYEHALLRLLSGEDALVRLEPEEARSHLARELATPNPDVTLFRRYAACDVWITTPASALPEMSAPESEDAWRTPGWLDDAAPAAEPAAEAQARPWIEPESPAAAPSPAARPAPAPSPAAGPVAEAPGAAAQATSPQAVAPRPGAPAPTTTPPTTAADGGLPPAQPVWGREPKAPAAPEPVAREAKAPAAPEPVAREAKPPAAPEPVAREAKAPAAPEPVAREAKAPATPEPVEREMPAAVPGAVPGAVPAAGLAECAFCGGVLPTDRAVRYCPHCGVDQQLRPCARCGEVLEASWRYCVSCGAPAPLSTAP